MALSSEFYAHVVIESGTTSPPLSDAGGARQDLAPVPPLTLPLFGAAQSFLQRV